VSFRARFVFSSWILFLLAGTLTALVVPVGEGFDETWHFEYVHYWSATKSLPPGPQLRLSQEVQSLLQTSPSGTVLHDTFPGLQTYDDFWRQPVASRESQDLATTQLRFSSSYVEAPEGFPMYESHQPGLYYWLCAPVFWLSSGLSVPACFMLVRLWSILIASTLIPLAFYFTLELSRSEEISYAAVLLTALFPGLYPDVARVSNDALAVPLATALCLALVRYVGKRSTSNAVWLGALMTLGLATKAIFIPLSIVSVILCLPRPKHAIGMLIGSCPSYFFYVRNARITGSWTGLPETVEAGTSVLSSLTAASHVDWLEVIRRTATTHIWTGFWSLLQYRSWMYEVVFYAFLIGLVGFALCLFDRTKPQLRVIALLYGVHWAALMYYGTQTLQRTGMPIIQGWYLTPLIAVESAMFCVGIARLVTLKRAGVCYLIAAIALLVLQLYGIGFIAAPYYSGLTDHAPSGHLRAYHPQWGDAGTISTRLTRWYAAIPSQLPIILFLAILTLGVITSVTRLASAKR
jgi:hypothetical protein